MKSKWQGLLVALVVLVWGAAEANAGKYVLHVQGRGWGSWQTDAANRSGWTSKTFNFDGSSRMNSSATDLVKSKVAQYCSSAHDCIIHCYSAGCLRVEIAIDELRSEGADLGGMWWLEASGGAQGGSELAEKATQGGLGWLAKLIGQREDVDYDLVPSVARSTYGPVHENLGATMYHVAGRKDVCKKVLWFKICGGKYLPGDDDGVVAFHSSCGYDSAGAFYNCCDSSESFTYHTYDDTFASCSGENEDHFGIPGVGNEAVDFANHPTPSWGDNVSGASHCSGANCDQPFVDDDADFSNKRNGTSIAQSVDGNPGVANTTGDTSVSCEGSCGGQGGTLLDGSTCYCDSACTANNDCCWDKQLACN